MVPSFLKKIDWWIIASLIPLFGFSLATMSSFSDAEGSLLFRQLLWIGISLGILFFTAAINFSFIKQSKIIFILYLVGVGLLLSLIFFGDTARGATSWFNLGAFSFQPTDLVKMILILILAKYLARRHIEIRAMKHLLITALYFVIPFFLIFLQPDFGSAIILFCIWFGMIVVAGISKKHLLMLFIAGVSVCMVMWVFVFKEYQKNRITSFLDPLSDIQGAGYNAYQSVIAVGSGELVGKGVGYGTQSRLNFLPEYETDFIFAAVSEEWGFIGSSIMIILFAIIVIRILILGSRMNGNFERLFSVGLAIYFMSHIIINVGMNIGLMPVTGVTLPFMSYGGSHLIIECLVLGMFMSFASRSKSVRKDDTPEVFLV